MPHCPHVATVKSRAVRTDLASTPCLHATTGGKHSQRGGPGLAGSWQLTLAMAAISAAALSHRRLRLPPFSTVCWLPGRIGARRLLAGAGLSMEVTTCLCFLTRHTTLSRLLPVPSVAPLACLSAGHGLNR